MQGDNSNMLKNGWTEYGKLVLSKLETLHQDNKDLKATLSGVNDRLAKLEAAQKDIEEIRHWQKEITDVWSPVQMKEAKNEVYEQKAKWTGAYAIFAAAQIVWGVLLVFKDKIFK